MQGEEAAGDLPSPSGSLASLGRPDDGYRVAKQLGAAAAQLREQLL